MTTVTDGERKEKIKKMMNGARMAHGRTYGSREHVHLLRLISVAAWFLSWVSTR